MRIGQLRFQVTIEESTEVSDAVGSTTTWSEFAKVWASITPLTGNEFYTAMQFSSELTHHVTIRYIPGITTKMRVNTGEKVLNIVAVINKDNRKAQIDLLCKEVVGAYHDSGGA